MRHIHSNSNGDRAVYETNRTPPIERSTKIGACQVRGTHSAHTPHVIWIGAILGALFGWAGIFFAACMWLFMALARLAFALIMFAAQVLIAISALIAELIVYLYRRLTRPPTTPDGLTPKRRKR